MYLRRNRSWIIGEAQGGGRCRTPLPPADNHTAGDGEPETSQKRPGRVQGERDRGKRNGRSAPRKRAGESPPTLRTPLDNWSSSRTPGGWAPLTWAAVGSPAAWRMCRNTSWSRSSTGRQEREIRGPPSYAAGQSANISSLVNMPT